ncbi:ribosylnicotinamide kinase [Xylographa carneopallida]|nr:ribosylnicotinamide kinase [Xylographa carneopallida]
MSYSAPPPPTTPSPLPSRPFTIALSGSSSAGKSTTAHILQTVLRPLFTIHQDDFNKSFADLPVRPNGRLDADAVESTDIPRFKAAVRHAQRTGGHMPPGFASWQDPAQVAAERALAVGRVSESARRAATVRLDAARRGSGVAIIEGWLLYQDAEIRRLADVRLFLRTSKAAAKYRRMTRPGYGDPDTTDFWRTEEYFEECVWGNYVKNSAGWFVGGDVEGEPDAERCRREGLAMRPSLDMGVEETFEWAVGVICEALEARAG